MPTADSLDLTGLDISAETLGKLFAVNRDDWYEETEAHRQRSSSSSATGSRRRCGSSTRRCGCGCEAPISLLKPGSEIRPLAAELNEVIERENPHVYAMLSELGKRLFFPKGILAQSAEAKEKAQDARRHHRHRPRERQADVPAVGDAALQRPHPGRGA